MKKRTPKQHVNNVENNILEENKIFYDDVMTQYYGNRKKRVRKISIWGGSAATVILAVVLCLVFLLPSEQPKHYLIENEVSVISDLDELNLDLQGLSISFSSEYEYVIRRTYDSKYEDNLFFTFSATNDTAFETISAYIYVNPKYERQNHMIEEPIKEVDVNGLEVKYKEKITKDADDIYTFIYTARIEYNDVAIYFEYEQLWFEDDTNFFNFIEDTFRIK